MYENEFLNVYAAKVVEYVLALVYLVLFVGFWRWVHGERAPGSGLRAARRSCEQDTPPSAGPQRAGRRAVSERGACGGGAGEAPTASPAEGGEGPLEMDELAERSEAYP